MNEIDPEFAKKLRMELGDGLGVRVELKIKLHENGSLSVAAPTHDRALCMLLLDSARDAILRHGRQEIVIPAKDLSLTTGNLR